MADRKNFDFCAPEIPSLVRQLHRLSKTSHPLPRQDATVALELGLSSHPRMLSRKVALSLRREVNMHCTRNVAHKGAELMKPDSRTKIMMSDALQFSQ